MWDQNNKLDKELSQGLDDSKKKILAYLKEWKDYMFIPPYMRKFLINRPNLKLLKDTIKPTSHPWGILDGWLDLWSASSHSQGSSALVHTKTQFSEMQDVA